MKSSRFNFQTLVILTIGMVLANAALTAPPAKVKVTNANPDNALQGEGLNVVITGEGFTPSSTVSFLVSGTSDDSQIATGAPFNVNGAGTELTVPIVVDGNALITDYDIEVRSGKRRGKGTTLFRVHQQGQGGGFPTNEFDIVYSGDLTGFGSAWTGGGSGQKNPPIGFWDADATGDRAQIDLGYFVNGVFSGQRGANCFGTGYQVNGAGGSVEKRKRRGRAYSHVTFWAYTDDGSSTPVKYIIHLWGTLVDWDDWMPEVHNTMIMDTWKIALMDPYNGQYNNVACIGESTDGEDFLTAIDIYRNN